MSKATTTAVDEKDLPEVPEAKLIGAPESLDAAIERIMELEMRLEDLARACEIASITRQFEILDGFKASADTALETKIQIEQPSLEDFKVTVLTNKEEDAKA